jgi:transposase
MPKLYRVRLEASERELLEAVIRKDQCAAHKQRHARILLKADENAPGGALSDQRIAEAVHVGTATVQRVRRIFVEHGLECALQRRDPDRFYERKLDAKGEAQLIALACEEPPDGRAKWTLQLLADKLVELNVVDSIGREAVRMTLKKTRSNPGKKGSGA